MNDAACGRIAVVAWAIAGCAIFTCTPVPVVVAEREARTRLREVVVGVRTTESGRVEDVLQMVPEQEYWVRSTAGRWYRVSADQYRVAAPGRALEVCP